MSQVVGFAAEDVACDYLISQGLRLVARNFESRFGEIDLILLDGEYLVFVEVRKRVSASFGGAAASVTKVKQQKLLRTASCYLSLKKLHDKQPVRFDVLSIEGSPPVMNWIQNAFGAAGW